MPPRSPRQAPAPVPPKPWPDFEASKAWPASTTEWFPAKGHYAGHYEALVRVSPAAFEAYLALSPNSNMLDGAKLVMLHRAPSSQAPGPIHVMQKQGGLWSFTALGPEGNQVETRAALCRRCHEEASTDLLFGPPREPLMKTGPLMKTRPLMKTEHPSE